MALSYPSWIYLSLEHFKKRLFGDSPERLMALSYLSWIN
jgi:hypothetical protein